MRRIIAPVILSLGLVLAGCSSSFQGSGDAAGPEHSVDSGGAQDESVQEAAPGDAESDRQVISVGAMRVITENPATAAGDAAGLGESRGGYVESREEWSDRDGEAVVDLTLRVPAAELDQLMTDVAETGEVAQRSQSAEDVTGAARDLDARIRALRISTERLEEIMAEADTSADLLAAEVSLSERQGELEELIAQRDDLEDQVSMSTLQVELRESDRTDDSGGFAGWLLDLWTTLLNSAGGLVIVLTALLPWAVVLGVPAYLLTRWIRRRWNRRGPRSEGSPTTGLPQSSGSAATSAPDSNGAAKG